MKANEKLLTLISDKECFPAHLKTLISGVVLLCNFSKMYIPKVITGNQLIRAVLKSSAANTTRKGRIARRDTHATQAATPQTEQGVCGVALR